MGKVARMLSDSVRDGPRAGPSPSPPHESGGQQKPGGAVRMGEAAAPQRRLAGAWREHVRVEEGVSEADLSLATGETAPVAVRPGDVMRVLAEYPAGGPAMAKLPS